MLKCPHDELDVRMGILTSGPLSDSDGQALLAKARLITFFDAKRFVSERTAMALPTEFCHLSRCAEVGVPIEVSLHR